MTTLHSIQSLAIFVGLSVSGVAVAQEEVAGWQYTPESMRAFWDAEVIENEPILFVRDTETGESSGEVLFPIDQILSVRSSAGNVVYQDGVDYRFERGTRRLIVAFGMNDSARRSAEEYRNNIAEIIAKTRKSSPNTEFILIASMLGNRDWTLLNHDVFPKYRDELAGLCGNGVALADMTSVWNEFFNRKKDADLTGNGVNHPNDFGHRVYAQVLSAGLIDERQTSKSELTGQLILE